MSARIRIAVDAMSGDLGPRVVISATQKFIALFKDVDIVLVGNEPLLASIVAENLLRQRIVIVDAAEVVTMDESPLHALRHRNNSSMWLAIESLKHNRVDACVSAGNTGALLAIGKHLLNTFPDIKRPAICKAMPVERGQTYFLDLGANAECTAEHLHQFALMGKVLASVVKNNPRIGLLNVGSEPAKGTRIIQAAQALLMRDARINYGGFIEADKIFNGSMDVIVCDGFHGNIALKSCEGTARFIAQKIKRLFNANGWTRLAGLMVQPILRRLRMELDPSGYNGAIFLGLQKILIKSHGNANEKAFIQALVVARDQVIQNIPARIQQELISQSASL